MIRGTFYIDLYCAGSELWNDELRCLDSMFAFAIIVLSYLLGKKFILFFSAMKFTLIFFALLGASQSDSL